MPKFGFRTWTSPRRKNNEWRSRHDTWYDTDRRVVRLQYFDRENDLYTETVKDDETGEILYEKTQRLSEKRGTGITEKKK